MKLEFVTKNEFYKTVVKRIVTITSTVENEFEESVLECAAKSTIIVKQEENPSYAATNSEVQRQVRARQVRGGGPDVDG